MHNQSLPPTDRDEPPAETTAHQLRALVRNTGLSNSQLAVAIGKSSATISLWLNGKYSGDVARLEATIREWLRDRTVARCTGVETVETEISRTLERRVEEIRAIGGLGIVIGPAGIGKSRAVSRYLIDHTLAISCRVTPWHSGMSALGDDISRAAEIGRLRRGERRWDSIIAKTAGSGRILIVDDAHELGQRALQCCVDYHEQSANPVALIGLPALKKRLLADDRRARRVDECTELTSRDPKPLVEHLVSQIAPDANGEHDALVGLSLQVVAGPGQFGAVEKQLTLASRFRRRKQDPRRLGSDNIGHDGLLRWVPAFHAAHKQLLRVTPLQ